MSPNRVASALANLGIAITLWAQVTYNQLEPDYPLSRLNTLVICPRFSVPPRVSKLRFHGISHYTDLWNTLPAFGNLKELVITSQFYPSAFDSDHAIQVICVYLRNLVKLVLYDGYHVTDFGLTGSRALYPYTGQQSESTGISLRDLKQLKHLALMNFPMVSGQAYVDAIQIPGLKILELSAHNNVSPSFVFTFCFDMLSLISHVDCIRFWRNRFCCKSRPEMAAWNTYMWI